MKRKGCDNSASFYGKFGRKYTLSGRAQEVLSTVLEDMIEETLEDARKLAQGTGKDKVAVEDVEMAMVNLCQRLHPNSNSRPDDIPDEYDLPKKSQHKYRNHQHQRRRHSHHERLKDSDSKRQMKWKKNSWFWTSLSVTYFYHVHFLICY